MEDKKYLIISVKDIQDRINDLEKEYEVFKGSSHLTHLQSLLNNIDSLKWMLNQKQISLNDSDIHINKLKLEYLNSEKEKSNAAWNSNQYITYDLTTRVKRISKKTLEFLRQKLRLSLTVHKGFGFEAGYKQALKDLL